jgi:outer membrane protein assembly factor BamE (lipoprotein component of BamABCDE complex)
MIKRILLVVLLLALAIAALHAYSLEGIDGWFFSRHFAQDTEYAPGYTDRAFRQVHRNMTEEQVRNVLPAPLGEVWIYEDRGPALASVDFAGERVESVRPGTVPKLQTVRPGMTKAAVLRSLGPPPEKTLVYSRRPTDVSYHVRVVLLRDGRVAKRISEFYLD